MTHWICTDRFLPRILHRFIVPPAAGERTHFCHTPSSAGGFGGREVPLRNHVSGTFLICEADRLAVSFVSFCVFARFAAVCFCKASCVPTLASGHMCCRRLHSLTRVPSFPYSLLLLLRNVKFLYQSFSSLTFGFIAILENVFSCPKRCTLVFF